MRLNLEHLESRENPYGSIGMQAGDLIIYGGIYNDSVVVTPLGGNWVRVTANGSVFKYNVWGGDIVFRGGQGNDYFRNDSNLRSVAFGGYGNDTLLGGGSRDAFAGGAGNDNLAGRNGSDFLDGGDGSDFLNGGGGADEIWSGYGYDKYVMDYNATVPDFDPSRDRIL